MPRDEPEPIALPDHVWRDPTVLHLCATHDANGLFRLARKYGVSNDRLSYWVGIPSGEISKRINNRVGPVIALDRWLQIADGLRMPDAARHAAGLAGRSVVAVAPEARPSAITIGGYVAPRLSEGLVSLAADESAQFAEWAEAADAGRFSVDQLAAELRQLSLDYLTGAPVPVFLGTRAVRDKAFRLLRGHSAPARANDLYTVAGYACTLLAWMSGDLGRPDAAETHARTGWICAELAGSVELRAWILSFRSKTAFWDGRLVDALDFARAGRMVAERSSVAVLLAAQEADTAASMGRGRDALTAVRGLDDLRATVDAPDALGGLLSCDSARQGNYAAAVYARIGRPQEAVREARSALASYRDNPRHARGTEMQVRISLALGHMADDALDGVSDALSPVLTTPEEQRLTTVASRMGEVTAALHSERFAGSRQADTIREAIADYRSVRVALPPAIEESPGDNR